MPKNVSRKTTISVSLILAGLAANTSTYAETISGAFASGRANIDLRYRYETVDDGDPATEDAKAATLRTRLGFTTGSYKDFKAHVDFEYTNHAGATDFNDGSNGKTGFAKVIDPRTEELNQAWLSYAGLSGTDMKVGRQRIILDNARFVGNVGWRQNEQTFDAFMITNKSFNDITLSIGNVYQINTITGGAVDTRHNFINVGFDKTPVGKLTAYTYLLDYDDPATSDIDTLGLRMKGNAGDLLYALEFAEQSDGGDNTDDFSMSYLFAEAGYKINATNVFLGYESLGSDDGVESFQTPLATKHAFNGWADKFLTTPLDGLNDTYIKVVSKFNDMKLVGFYHDFSSDFGSTDYGTELDLVLIKPLGKNLKGLVKYSDFSADSNSTYDDTQKIWLSLEGKFSQ